jgi:hypothetical protein
MEGWNSPSHSHFINKWAKIWKNRREFHNIFNWLQIVLVSSTEWKGKFTYLIQIENFKVFHEENFISDLLFSIFVCCHLKEIVMRVVITNHGDQKWFSKQISANRNDLHHGLHVHWQFKYNQILFESPGTWVTVYWLL